MAINPPRFILFKVPEWGLGIHFSVSHTLGIKLGLSHIYRVFFCLFYLYRYHQGLLSIILLLTYIGMKRINDKDTIVG